MKKILRQNVLFIIYYDILIDFKFFFFKIDIIIMFLGYVKIILYNIFKILVQFLVYNKYLKIGICYYYIQENILVIIVNYYNVINKYFF